MGGKPRKKPELLIKEGTRPPTENVSSLAQKMTVAPANAGVSIPQRPVVNVQPSMVLTLRACRRVRLANMEKRFGKILGGTLHSLGWILHNCVVHPIAGLFPYKPVFWLHDKTSRLMGRLQ